MFKPRAVVANDDSEMKSSLHRLAESVPIGLAYAGIEGSYRYANQAFANWLNGGNPCAGLKIAEVGGFDPRKLESYVSQVQAGESVLFDHELSDGNTTIRISLQPDTETSERHPEGFFVCAEDVTTLKQSAADAEAANEMKSRFLANMSHELRTPMNGVLGMSAHLMDMPLGDEVRESVSIIKRSAESLLEMIDEILDYSKIESGKWDIEISPVDIRALVREITDLLAFRIESRPIDMVVDIAPDVPQTIQTDAARIRQILYNLAGNALKFTDEGMILVEVRLRDEEGTLFVDMAVSDTGMGIPEEKHEQVFSSFIQADASTTRQFGGTGLGLTICKQLAELMNGSIALKSELGEGSTFTLSLPLGSKGDDFEAVAIQKPFAGQVAAIINDNVRENELLVSWLERQDINVHVIDDMKQLAELPKAVDMCLLDSGMNAKIESEVVDLVREHLNEPDATTFVMLRSHIRSAASDQLLLKRIAAHQDRPLWEHRLIETLQHVCLPHDVEMLSDDELLAHLEARAKANQTGHNKSALIERKHILVAEDNPINQIVIQKMLEKAGAKLTMVTNGWQAVEAVRGNTFDAILMDCQMPEMDGFEATKTIRDMSKKGEISYLPIIAVTADASPKDRENCLNAGMDEYIPKPVDQDKLYQTLTNCLVMEDAGSGM